MDKDLGYTHHMGLQLRAEVERQLLKDFQRYAHERNANLTLDWSDTCPEGHVTEYLDGLLENWSGVAIVNAPGERIAWGWIDFIHGGRDNPLFVFWYYLHLGENTEDVVQTQGIPQHIWDGLPERSQDLCLQSKTYDAAWKNDPLVLRWKHQKSQDKWMA